MKAAVLDILYLYFLYYSIILLFCVCLYLACIMGFFGLHSPRQKFLVAKRGLPWSWQGKLQRSCADKSV